MHIFKLILKIKLLWLDRLISGLYKKCSVTILLGVKPSRGICLDKHFAVPSG